MAERTSGLQTKTLRRVLHDLRRYKLWLVLTLLLSALPVW